MKRRTLSAMALFNSISAWLSRAMAKEVPFADVKAFRNAVMAAFRARPGVESVVPDVNDSARFTIMFRGQSSTADVTNLFGYLSAYPKENAQEAIARFVNAITQDGSSIEDGGIVAVIRGLDWLQQVTRTGLDVLHESAGADLVTVYMADRPDSMQPISTQALPGKTLKDVRTIAQGNLRRWLPKVISDDSLGYGILYYVEGNTMLSTGLLILDEFWTSIAARFPADVLFAIPRRDQLFIFNDDGSEKTEALARRLIDATFADNFNLLSPLLYARRDRRIVVAE